MAPEENDALAALGALGDDTRRGMYAFIRRAHRPVSREEAAESVGISRKLAAFHLDKLVDVGLLRTRFDAPGRTRKVGRAPKLYEPAPDAIRVSIPERRHELLAEILAAAVTAEEPDRPAREAALEVADRRGHAFGSHERERHRPGRLGTERALSLAACSLEEFGFEPERTAPDQVLLRNCPFHPLAITSTDLVCGINHRFLTGFLRGLGADGAATAVLHPDEEACCVRLCSSGHASCGEPEPPAEASTTYP
ncbi:helix-turn-helix transcriptional regulator [Actinospica robiniae]|uniref:helix-turn-helix transcriptional regulator n=1 Tax=Actinospica robiniae TaxID=304901 RepID=UPI000423E20B|nr:helix-turn-helix domain-containing protein [Actinospica robiniae]